MTTNTFWIESGTGTQINDPAQLSATKTYTQSGTGTTGLGSSFYTAPTAPTATTLTSTGWNPTQVGNLSGSTTYGATNTAPTAPTAPATQPTPTTQPTTTTQTQQINQPLTFNGSIVDLLNSAGVDSSLDARIKLASQYGMQGYTGNTAAQQKELADKFIAAFNANKGTTVPQSGAEASSAIESYLDQSGDLTDADPMRQFMDMFGSMNPMESEIFKQLSTILSTPINTQSLTEFYKQEIAAQIGRAHV